MDKLVYASPLLGSSVFHYPDEYGFPTCRSVENRPQAYMVDRNRKLPVALVIESRRCTLPGCVEGWASKDAK